MRKKPEITESERDCNVRNVMALCALRKESAQFLRLALEEMTDAQVCILLQKIVEWMNENPPKKEKGA